MPFKFYKNILIIVSLGVLISLPLQVFGQSLSFKNGSLMERMVPKGKSQVLQVVDSRGQLQWQKSNDGIIWQDWAGKNQISLSVAVDDILYLRCAIQEANCAPVYSDVVKLIPANLATITTAKISEINNSSAIGGGTVISDGNTAVTGRGVCWSTLQNPTIEDSVTNDGAGTGTFVSILTNLSGNTTYYVRAYCTNLAGTNYGEEVNFTTRSDLDCDGEVTDLRDGKQYCYKKIGSQTWMIENMAFLPTIGASANGSQTSPYYYVYNYEGNSLEEARSEASYSLYGVLYNWEAAKTACPSGWHLPADVEWKALEISLGMSPTENISDCDWQLTGSIGKKLKSTFAWSGNVDNSSGFTALPAGYWAIGGFNNIGSLAAFWSASSYNTLTTLFRGMSNDLPDGVLRCYGVRSSAFSVRCLQNGLAIVTTDEVTGVDRTTATFSGNVACDGGTDVTARGICWATTPNPVIEDNLTINGTGIGFFTSTISNLTGNTTYYARAYSTNSSGTSYGNEVSFKTSPVVPEVTTATVSDITQTTATSGGAIINDGGTMITARGICWSTMQNPTILKNITTDGTGNEPFVSSLTGLTGNTSYYVRAYATNSQGTSYGNEVSFTTSPVLPSLTTTSVSDIKQTTATSGGNISSDGGGSISERGICWSTSQLPTIADNKTSDGTGTGSFTASLTNLTGNTTYYVRSYGTNVAGTGYGNEISFKTSPVLSTVTTIAVSAITQTTALSGSHVTNDGGNGIIARGVCWSTSPKPDITDNKTVDGSGTGTVASTLTNLTGNTTYYVRAYATNSVGTSYGNELSFKTSPVQPTIATGPVINITQSTASSGGNITDDGGADVTARGVCWSRSPNPTRADSLSIDGIGKGVFASNLTKLTGNTIYYVRAYATNSAGTSYGNELSFKTSPVVPAVTTAPVSSITQTSAVSGGNVIADGGLTVSVRGICWSTLQNPTIADNKTNNGSGTGAFSSNLTGLTGNTIYYVRAYSTNSLGTGYGNEISFKTNPLLADLSTTAISDVTQTTAVSGGNITSDGGADITARGVCWSLSANPTIADSKTNDGTGIGSFTSNLTGLTGNTTYYLRAYSSNSAGTSYGNEIGFKTSPVSPAITTTAVSAITSSSATSGGNITSDGGAAIIARGVCWSTSPSPTIEDGKTSDGASPGVFTSSLTGLTGNTLYYVRAYASNNAGITYGKEVSFTTSPVLSAITTTAVSSITQTTASSGGNIISDGGAPITARGVCWAITPNPTIEANKTTDGTGTGLFVSNLTNLTGNTTYYLRAYSTNNIGTSYGNEISFKTSPVMAVITTANASAITQTTANSGGNIVTDGGAGIIARGVCWSTTANPTIVDNKTTDGTGTGSFTSHLTGLTGNITHYVRAFAINSAGTSYGNEISFNTSPVLPSVSTAAISGVSQTSAVSGGNVTSDGGAQITARGVCWSTSTNPTITDSKTSDGSGSGIFTSIISGLSGNTTYFVRAYSTNSAGTSYGDQVSFTTKIVLACDGTFTDERSSQQYCYKTIGTQTWMAENLAYLPSVDPPSIGSETSPHYYVYDYSGNSVEEARAKLNYSTYGVLYNWEAAKTACPSGWHLPSDEDWNTLEIYLGKNPEDYSDGCNWHYTGQVGKKLKASSGWQGNADNSSGFAALPAGIWAVGGFASIGSVTTFWTSSVYLFPYDNSNAWYRGMNNDFPDGELRCFGARSGGFSVRCLKNDLATIVTANITEITQTSAVAGGMASSNGGSDITARGVCWSTSSTPTVADSKTADGTGTGSFTSSIKGLTGNTTYFVRAYSTNSLGTSYGAVVTFKTSPVPSTITTTAVSAITQTTATSGGNVSSDGGTPITTRGVCWSTSPVPTIADSKTSDGTGTGMFTSNLSDLTANTIYHVRSYATNSAGTSYGDPVSFATKTLLNCEGTITDARNARDYCYKTIGTQTWMIENLAYLPSVSPPSNGSENAPYYYVYDYTGSSVEEAKSKINYSIYGVLYNWEAAKTACPSGWHLPSDEDWNILEIYLGKNPAENPDGCNWHYTGQVGKKLKSTSGWIGNADNSSGFSALPAGIWAIGGFKDIGSLAAFWSSSAYLFPFDFTNSWFRGMNNAVPDGELRCFGARSSAFSVRCLKNSQATVTTTNITGITQTSAVAGGTVLSDGGSAITARGVCWSTSPSPTIADNKTTDGTGTGSFTSNITGLTGNTTYFFRAYSTNSLGTSYGTAVNFKTSPLPSTIMTADVSAITQTSATSGGNVTSDGGAPITARGVCWSTTSNPTIAGSKTTDGTGTGLFTSTLAGLTANTTYHVRAYATSSAGTAYGNDVVFTTSQNSVPLAVTTTAVSGITHTSGIGGGNVTGDGGSTVTTRGVCWSSTTPAPTIDNDKTTDGSGTGSFTSNITGLVSNTNYFVRAYVTNSSGTVYGNYVSFRTIASLGLPVVTTVNPSAITATAAAAGGNITSDGGAAVTARGVCWSISTNPTIDNSKTSDGVGTGTFTSSITGLTANTTYHLRAYATNSVGTAYGNEVILTTSQISAPLAVTTTGISGITHSSGIGGGNVTGDGGSAVTARGVCWSTTSSGPTTDNDKTIDGNGTGSFISNLTRLSGNTTYFVRAYATNSTGTVYGNYVSFKTAASLGLPIVTTSSISAITTTTALSGGNVTNDGGSGITVRGVCWSTSAYPTIANSVSSNGAGTGTFASNITGLTANTTYHVRAYATNSIGTAYGNEVIFTTSQNSAPLAVTTTAISAITHSSATGGGTVTGDGGSLVTARGVCWSATSSSPTIDNHKTIDGSGTGTFSSNIAGLSSNTTYYVRAYATNSSGTVYGNYVSFKSNANLGLPTVTTGSISGISTTTAIAGGNVTSDGGAALSARGVCWSRSANPTIANSITNNGTGLGSYTSSLNGLTANTTYFVRAYATNSAGTAYGNEVIFTTSQNSSALAVTTTAISVITQSSGTGGGNVTGDGGSLVTARGVCWSSTSSAPTIDNPKTTDGNGTGSFTSNLSGLSSNTTYFVRAYATTSAGTVYGNYVSFTTLRNAALPTVTTNSVSAVTQTTAVGGGNATDDAGAAITARGICWSTSSNPTISGSKTIDGAGKGTFTSSMTGLTAGATYYVRAYATNSLGTGYGQVVQFTTTGSGSGNTFDYAGRTYTFKTLGSQTWMTENLAYLPSVSPSSNVSYTSPNYYIYNYNGSNVTEAKSNPNYITYGVLYNWEAAKTACPPGWHLPSEAEWTTLASYLGWSPGGKIKENGTARWLSPNTGATNESGFRALPAGHVYHNGGFYDLGHTTDFWSSTSAGSSSAWHRGLVFNFEGMTRFYIQTSYGLSVRCVRN